MLKGRAHSSFHIGLGEATGSVADLGIFVPLAISLVVVNHLDAGSVLLAAGLLIIAAGLVFKVPFPVQPLKALTAVAVAQQLAPGVIHAAGLEIGVFLLLLSIRHVAAAIAKAFTKPVVRALQLGVGVLLLITAGRLVADPPAAFSSTPVSPWPIVLGIAALAGVVWAVHTKHFELALALLAGGLAVAVVAAHPHLSGPSLQLPRVAFPPAAAFGTAFTLLVIPQIPLTFGNAVVAVEGVSHEYFGERASRVTTGRVCLTSGAGNLVSALIGGMPMCHGSGGLTAHVRLGARSAGMNLLLGGVMACLGLFFASQVVVLLGLLPIWVLAAFLAYAGARHAMLAFDLRGWELALALAAGLVGARLGNLAITAAIALIAVHGVRLWKRIRRDPA